MNVLHYKARIPVNKLDKGIRAFMFDLARLNVYQEYRINKCSISRFYRTNSAQLTRSGKKRATG